MKLLNHIYQVGGSSLSHSFNAACYLHEMDKKQAEETYLEMTLANLLYGWCQSQSLHGGWPENSRSAFRRRKYLPQIGYNEFLMIKI